MKDYSGTHSLGPTRGRFLSLGYHFTGDAAAAEVGTLVLRVHPDQPVHVRVGGRGFLQRSVLLLNRHLRLDVLATFPGQQVVPNFAISRGVGTVPAQLGGRVLSVSPGQKRADTSGTPGGAVGRGVFAVARFGADWFGTDAGHHPRFAGLWL